MAPTSHQRQPRKGRMAWLLRKASVWEAGTVGMPGVKGQCWCPASPLCSPINPDLMVPEEFALSPWPAGGGRMCA